MEKLRNLEAKSMELFFLFMQGVQRNADFSGELDDESNQIRSARPYRRESVQMDLLTEFTDLLLSDNDACLMVERSCLYKCFKSMKCDQYFLAVCILSRQLKRRSESTNHNRSDPGGKMTPNKTFFYNARAKGMDSSIQMSHLIFIQYSKKAGQREDKKKLSRSGHQP